MSANNGNRSRFHRNRKRRLARLMQTRELMKGLPDKKEAKGPTRSAHEADAVAREKDDRPV